MLSGAQCSATRTPHAVRLAKAAVEVNGLRLSGQVIHRQVSLRLHNTTQGIFRHASKAVALVSHLAAICPLLYQHPASRRFGRLLCPIAFSLKGDDVTPGNNIQHMY